MSNSKLYDGGHHTYTKEEFEKLRSVKSECDIEKSFLDECMVKSRPDESPLFYIDARGNVYARLRRYAIIPTEEYENLRAQQELLQELQSPIGTKKS